MNVKQPESVPKVEIDLCMALEGKRWKVGNTEIRFGVTEKKGKLNVRPYPSGIEAYAYRVTDQGTRAPAFLKLYKTDLTNKRLRRIEWLISQELWRWDESFRGSPRNWISTQLFGKPDGIHSDFGGVWLLAVPGSTWHACRTELETGKIQWPDSLRTSLARQLIRSLAILERIGMTHGDISDMNILIHVENDAAKLYVIDFDGFVLRPTKKTPLLRRWVIRAIRAVFNLPTFFSEDIPTLSSQYCRLTATEGGTIGTRNYAPPELMKAYDQKQLHDLAPVSDSHARDVLLVELLCCGRGVPVDESPLDWGSDALQAAAQLLQSSTISLPHLIRGNSLDLAPKFRPSSIELADQLAIDLPHIHALREATPCIRSGFSQFPLTSADAKKPQRAAWSFAGILLLIFLVYHFNAEPVPPKPPPVKPQPTNDTPDNANKKIALVKTAEPSPAYERQEQLLLLRLQRSEFESRTANLITAVDRLEQRLQKWDRRLQTLAQSEEGKRLASSAREIRFLKSLMPLSQTDLGTLRASLKQVRVAFIQADVPLSDLTPYDSQLNSTQTSILSFTASFDSLEATLDELLASSKPSSEKQTLAEAMAKLDSADTELVNQEAAEKKQEMQTRFQQEIVAAEKPLEKLRDQLAKAQGDLKQSEADCAKQLAEAQSKRDEQLRELTQKRLAAQKRLEEQLPQFRSRLSPFITPSYRQLKALYGFKVVIDAQPISYSGLLRTGALDNDAEGLDKFLLCAGRDCVEGRNDRPVGSFPRPNNWMIDTQNPQNIQEVKAVQEFLRRHGEAMVEAKLLAP